MKSVDAGCVTLGLSPSFGFGDRTGLATPGHVAAMQAAGGGIEPIFAQQSIREMSRTGRNPQQVMEQAVSAARRAGWTGRMGADADHLKTTADVDVTAKAGFTFFTIDPSGFVEPRADGIDPPTLRAKYAEVADEVGWVEEYVGKRITLATGTAIELTEEACLRGGVKYGRAVNHTVGLAEHIRQVQSEGGRDYEIELSVDETEQPTTLAEHFLIAERCLSQGMKLVSLAPRFVGEFEKGVDFKGDLDALTRSLADHAAIAAMLGPYKLSLHSGSDKLSVYRALARHTGGRFHVKTAGTSYLEALRVVARHEPRLFRELVEFCRSRYDADKATYHVSATLDTVPAPSEVVDDERLEAIYLERWPDVAAGKGFTAAGRQILHCTFGSVLSDPVWGGRVREVLLARPETYAEVLKDHFERHLQALQEGLAEV